MKKKENHAETDPTTRKNQKILNNFYIREMNKGKSPRAILIDRMALAFVFFIFSILLLEKVIGKVIWVFFLSVLISLFSGIYITRLSLKIRRKKIQDFKLEYRRKLEEDRLLSEEEDLEVYLIKRYYDKKEEAKSSFSFYNRDKIFKFYLFAALFYMVSFFVSFPTYYKFLAVLSFILGTIIASFNLTDYIRKKDLNSLLKRDIDV